MTEELRRLKGLNSNGKQVYLVQSWDSKLPGDHGLLYHSKLWLRQQINLFDITNKSFQFKNPNCMGLLYRFGGGALHAMGADCDGKQQVCTD